MNLLNNRLLKTELVEWKKLIPFQPDNLKKTEPHKLQKLANSLCENGFSMNFYVWEKDGQIYIIDGHSRQEVLQLLESGAIYPKDPNGKEYQVTIPDKFPCSFLHLKNKAEAKKAVLIYNSKYKSIDSDILSEWVSDLSLDELKSQIEIPELKLDFDLPQDLEADSIDDTAKITTNIKLGDLIEIGNHRLLCGDSTKKEDVERLMDGRKADITFTSPPYNAGKTATESKMGKDSKYINDSDDKSESEYIQLLSNFTELSLLFSSYVFVNIQSLSGNKIVLIEFLYKLKEKYADSLIWDKGHAQPAMANNVLNSEYEYIHCFSEKANRAIGVKTFRGTISNILRIGKQTRNEVKEHNATFPIELPSFFISNFSDKLVYEPFTGSGTTMVACQTLDRICYGMELEPLYCQVIINRMRKNFPELEIKVNGQIYAE